VCGLLFLLALIPLASHAQKFKDPTPDELAMTSDAKAPGASAVILYREEVTDNFNHFISEYVRIKILTAEGLNRAEVAVPRTASGHGPVIEARIIHPDGKIVPLNPPSSAAIQSRNDGTHYFTMPAASVGSILEYRWTLAIGDALVSGVTPGQQEFQNSALASSVPFWNVQPDLFAHKEHFYYNPLSDQERNVIGNLSITRIVDGEIAHYILFSAHLPAGAQVQVSPKQDYTLDLVDVPAFVTEADAPPEANTRYSVRFYFTPYLAPDTFWAAEGKRWSKEVDQAAAPTADLQAAAAQLTAGATTDDAKARKLYDAVQALTNTAFVAGSGEGAEQLGGAGTPRNAQAVWIGKGGSPSELAIVYLALARAAGLHVSAMRINDRRRMFFDPNYLALDQLPALIVVFHAAAGDVFLDPGQKMLPFGDLHWAHTLCGGLLETATGTTASVTTPPNSLKDSVSARLADLTLDSKGGVTGSVKLLMNGPFALHWRQMNLSEGSQAVEGKLNELLADSLPTAVSGTVRQIHGIDTTDGYFEVVAQIAGQIGKSNGKQLEMPTFFFNFKDSTALANRKGRAQPLAMKYAGQEIDDAVFHLPSGFSIVSAPQSQQLPWPGHAAMVVNVQAGAGVIEVKRIFARSFVLLPAQDLPALQGFYQKVIEADQQTVVFAPSVSTGN
jgi:hypothetical protein